jgi:hypothetical protein
VRELRYHEPSWDPAPRRIKVTGRIIRLGWHPGVDPRVISLTGSYGDHGFELLVVPPYTDPVTACRVMTLAAGPQDHVLPGPRRQSAPAGVRTGGLICRCWSADLLVPAA